MELKLRITKQKTGVYTRFNRTFMELKRTILLSIEGVLLCFNRTFMELKLQQLIDDCDIERALIGPSWN